MWRAFLCETSDNICDRGWRSRSIFGWHGPVGLLSRQATSVSALSSIVVVLLMMARVRSLCATALANQYDFFDIHSINNNRASYAQKKILVNVFQGYWRLDLSVCNFCDIANRGFLETDPPGVSKLHLPCSMCKTAVEVRPVLLHGISTLFVLTSLKSSDSSSCWLNPHFLSCLR